MASDIQESVNSRRVFLARVGTGGLSVCVAIVTAVILGVASRDANGAVLKASLEICAYMSPVLVLLGLFASLPIEWTVSWWNFMRLWIAGGLAFVHIVLVAVLLVRHTAREGEEPISSDETERGVLLGSVATTGGAVMLIAPSMVVAETYAGIGKHIAASAAVAVVQVGVLLPSVVALVAAALALEDSNESGAVRISSVATGVLAGIAAASAGFMPALGHILEAFEGGEEDGEERRGERLVRWRGVVGTTCLGVVMIGVLTGVSIEEFMDGDVDETHRGAALGAIAAYLLVEFAFLSKLFTVQDPVGRWQAVLWGAWLVPALMAQLLWELELGRTAGGWASVSAMGAAGGGAVVYAFVFRDRVVDEEDFLIWTYLGRCTGVAIAALTVAYAPSNSFAAPSALLIGMAIGVVATFLSMAVSSPREAGTVIVGGAAGCWSYCRRSLEVKREKMHALGDWCCVRRENGMRRCVNVVRFCERGIRSRVMGAIWKGYDAGLFLCANARIVLHLFFSLSLAAYISTRFSGSLRQDFGAPALAGLMAVETVLFMVLELSLAFPRHRVRATAFIFVLVVVGVICTSVVVTSENDSEALCSVVRPAVGGCEEPPIESRKTYPLPLPMENRPYYFGDHVASAAIGWAGISILVLAPLSVLCGSILVALPHTFSVLHPESFLRIGSIACCVCVAVPFAVMLPIVLLVSSVRQGSVYGDSGTSGIVLRSLTAFAGILVVVCVGLCSVAVNLQISKIRAEKQAKVSVYYLRKDLKKLNILVPLATGRAIYEAHRSALSEPTPEPDDPCGVIFGDNGRPIHVPFDAVAAISPSKANSSQNIDSSAAFEDLSTKHYTLYRPVIGDATHTNDFWTEDAYLTAGEGPTISRHHSTSIPHFVSTKSTGRFSNTIPSDVPMPPSEPLGPLWINSVQRKEWLTWERVQKAKAMRIVLPRIKKLAKVNEELIEDEDEPDQQPKSPPSTSSSTHNQDPTPHSLPPPPPLHPKKSSSISEQTPLPSPHPPLPPTRNPNPFSSSPAPQPTDEQHTHPTLLLPPPPPPQTHQPAPEQQILISPDEEQQDSEPAIPTWMRMEIYGALFAVMSQPAPTSSTSSSTSTPTRTNAAKDPGRTPIKARTRPSHHITGESNQQKASKPPPPPPKKPTSSPIPHHQRLVTFRGFKAFVDASGLSTTDFRGPGRAGDAGRKRERRRSLVRRRTKAGAVHPDVLFASVVTRKGATTVRLPQFLQILETMAQAAYVSMTDIGESAPTLEIQHTILVRDFIFSKSVLHRFPELINRAADVLRSLPKTTSEEDIRNELLGMLWGRLAAAAAQHGFSIGPCPFRETPQNHQKRGYHRDPSALPAIPRLDISPDSVLEPGDRPWQRGDPSLSSPPLSGQTSTGREAEIGAEQYGEETQEEGEEEEELPPSCCDELCISCGRCISATDHNIHRAADAVQSTLARWSAAFVSFISTFYPVQEVAMKDSELDAEEIDDDGDSGQNTSPQEPKSSDPEHRRPRRASIIVLDSDSGGESDEEESLRAHHSSAVPRLSSSKSDHEASLHPPDERLVIRKRRRAAWLFGLRWTSIAQIIDRNLRGDRLVIHHADDDEFDLPTKSAKVAPASNSLQPDSSPRPVQPSPTSQARADALNTPTFTHEGPSEDGTSLVHIFMMPSAEPTQDAATLQRGDLDVDFTSIANLIALFELTVEFFSLNAIAFRGESIYRWGLSPGSPVAVVSQSLLFEPSFASLGTSPQASEGVSVSVSEYLILFFLALGVCLLYPVYAFRGVRRAQRGDLGMVAEKGVAGGKRTAPPLSGEWFYTKFLTLFGSILYLMVIKTVLGMLSCQYDAESGRSVLFFDRGLECWGGAHVVYVGLAVVALLLYHPVATLIYPAMQFKDRSLDLKWDTTWLVATSQAKLIVGAFLVFFPRSTDLAVCLLASSLVCASLSFATHVAEPCIVQRANLWRSVSMASAAWSSFCAFLLSVGITVVAGWCLLFCGWLVLLALGGGTHAYKFGKRCENMNG